MRDEIRHIVDRSVRVYTAFLIDELIGRLAVRDDYHVRRTDSEREYRAVLISPSFESVLEQILEIDMGECGKGSRQDWTTYFLPNPVLGIWRALPRRGTVGGPGGMRGWRLPILDRRHTAVSSSSAEAIP